MRDSAPSEDDSSLLLLIIDTNPFVWQRASEDTTDPLPFSEALKHILVFIDAYLALKHDNRLAVIASHVGQSKFLHPLPHSTHPTGVPHANDGYETSADEETPEKNSKSRKVRNANEYQNFTAVTDKVVAHLRDLINDIETPVQQPDKSASMMAGALSMALSYINRKLKNDELGHIKARICVISVSADSAYQYIPVMNAIFSAQKMTVPIDVCKLFDEETVFLQQAAHLTGGIYQRADRPSGLLQYLLYTFLRDPYTRTLLVNPSEDRVDFRAACFCHKKIIDIGHVCSVCLSIFCSFSPICTTCKTKFSFAPLKPGGQGLGRGAGPSRGIGRGQRK